MEQLSGLRWIVVVTLLLVVGSSPAASDGSQNKAHFVLVHGLGHGAWCWYEVATLLKASGNQVTTIDLASNGRDRTVADSITTIAGYIKPLTSYLDTVASSDTVVLVGHSSGGLPITVAAESYSSKIDKLVFLTAAMPKNNQSFFDVVPPSVFSSLLASSVLVPKFANPANPNQITSLGFGSNATGTASSFYKNSPDRDVNLALSLLTNTPFVPLAETISLTPSNYGSVRRFFIKTGKDQILSQSLQTSIMNNNPPERTFTLSDSDHASFFSVPIALSILLGYISNL